MSHGNNLCDITIAHIISRNTQTHRQMRKTESNHMTNCPCVFAWMAGKKQASSESLYLSQVVLGPYVEVSNDEKASRHYYVWHPVKKLHGDWKMVESIGNKHAPKFTKVWQIAGIALHKLYPVAVLCVVHVCMEW